MWVEDALKFSYLLWDKKNTIKIKFDYILYIFKFFVSYMNEKIREINFKNHFFVLYPFFLEKMKKRQKNSIGWLMASPCTKSRHLYMQVESSLLWSVDQATVMGGTLHCTRLDLRLGLLPLLDWLNPLLQKRLRGSFHCRDHNTRVTQQLLYSFFILPTFLHMHYDTCKCC